MMFIQKSSLVILALAAASSSAFTGSQPSFVTIRSTALSIGSDLTESDVRSQLNYEAGAADSEFAKRYKHLVGKKIRTSGEAFALFTRELGETVNPLYKGMVTDLVGVTHLIAVNARFQRDPVWSLGILSALDLLLKNYPEQDVGEKIVSALFTSVGLDEAEVRAEAAVVTEWMEGKTRQDVEDALEGKGDSPIAKVAQAVKADEFWMYSRYFGIGLLKVMESTGVEMDKDEVYPVMETWMSEKMGRSHLTACADSDLFFRVKSKLDMMETMMKEIEIREKKRMAERLEDKAEQALRAAEREVKFQAEIAKEAASGAKELVESS